MKRLWHQTIDPVNIISLLCISFHCELIHSNQCWVQWCAYRKAGINVLIITVCVTPYRAVISYCQSLIRGHLLSCLNLFSYKAQHLYFLKHLFCFCIFLYRLFLIWMWVFHFEGTFLGNNFILAPLLRYQISVPKYQKSCTHVNAATAI